MSKLLRGLAFAFLLLGIVCAADAAAGGGLALAAGACFVLELVFVWLNLRHGGEMLSANRIHIDQPHPFQLEHRGTGDGFAVPIEVRNPLAANDGAAGGRHPATGAQAPSPMRNYQ